MAGHTMDFFAYQDQARRKTGLLVLYFLLAVLLIVGAVHAAIVILLAGAGPEGTALARWRPDLLPAIAGATLAIIGLGTLYKIASLARGGEAVASLLGGRPIEPNTTQLDERRLLNVVEEMALASGTPVPRVFVLDGEPGINAFAAGFSTRHAVIGVTRGALARLTRDELQGVIAHEFSHILNGDMRLNLKLMGVLHGILLISLLGYWIFRAGLYSPGRGSSGSGRRRNSNPAVQALLGLALMAIGAIGVFFGKLIKSAVARQREFLADAASVQYTRNPAGLAGALKKIGGSTDGARLRSPHAEEASHLFFANGLRRSLLNLMATHPPLDERIRRIDPLFDGTFRVPALRPPGPDEATLAAGLAVPGPDTGRSDAVRLQPRETLGRIGRPQADALERVMAMRRALPPVLAEAVREPDSAAAVLCSLLLDPEADLRAAQLHAVEREAGPDAAARAQALYPLAATLPAAARLPLAELAVLPLRGLPAARRNALRALFRSLIEADAGISLFEYMIERLVQRRLIGDGRPAAIRFYDLAPLAPEVGVLLSTLAYYGETQGAPAPRALAAGAARLRIPVSLLPPEACGLEAVDQALARLNGASPAVKKIVIEACLACAAADGHTTVAEAELLRAVADALECPLPPFAADAA